MKNKKYTFIDLFSGCGGLSEGFLATKRFEALAHVEWELPMVTTLRNRLVKEWGHSADDALKSVVHFDIQKTKKLIGGNWSESTESDFIKTNHNSIISKGLKGLVGDKQVDLIIGGPPCQAYSIAGRAQDPNSMKEDYRNYLFESFIEVVKAFKPKAFVFENVPGLLSACPGDIAVTHRIFEAFKKAGYTIYSPDKIKKAVYTASDFEVPQKRNRVIIIGVRKNSSFKLEDFYSSIDTQKNTGNLKTVKDAIGSLPPIIPLRKNKRVDGKNISHEQTSGNLISQHYARFHNERDIAIFKKWLDENMNYAKSEEKIAFYNKLHNKNSNHAKYRNLEWDKPSPTIVAHLYKDGLMFIHPDKKQLRSITIREAALLQSFPSNYEFIGSTGTCFKMIGNAVPPKLAENIAFAIVKQLDKHGK